jgi:hypothetical protein
MRYIPLLLATLLIVSTGCSIKTIVHPYPAEHSLRIENEENKFEIQLRDGDYFLLNKILADTSAMEFRSGTLEVTDRNYPDFRKVDSFIDPINGQTYYLDSFAFYDSQNKYDQLSTSVYNEADSLLGIVSGIPESGAFSINGNEYRFELVDSWMDGYDLIEEDGIKYYHHYPYGGEINIFKSDRIYAKVIQGAVVDKTLSRDSYRGVSYMVIFPIGPTEQDLPDIVTTLMAYFSFVDMNYYYTECDYAEPQADGSCPGSIIVK